MGTIEINSHVKKASRKIRMETGRLGKRDALTKEQECNIKA
jgi:hypothetical protein